MIKVIAKRAYESCYFNELMIKLESRQVFNFLNSDQVDNSFFTDKEKLDILRFADLFASTDEYVYRNIANKIISIMSNFYMDDESFKALAHTVFVKMGLFPSVDYLYNKTDIKDMFVSKDIAMLEKYKKTLQKNQEYDVVYTDKQYEVVSSMKNKNNFSLSAPTSFGKTMIISNFMNDVIHNHKGVKLCILVPTNALLKEITADMKERYESKANNGVKVLNYPEVKQRDLQYNALIFVFTPERLMSFFSQNDIDIDYLFIDEAQKVIKENDERTPIYYSAITYASYKGSKLFFLSPNIENPTLFLNLVERDEKNTKVIKDKLVSQNRYLIDCKKGELQYLDYNNKIVVYNGRDFCLEKTSDVVKKIFVENLNETQTLVYFSSKQKMIDFLISYINGMPNQMNEEIESLISLIKDTVHEKYYLIKALEKGIAFHFGQMPKLIREKIEILFKKKKIKLLLSTSTLLEGVNIQAKNIILTTNKNGKSDLQEEDFLNLIGRAGRFRSELFGNIICLITNEYKNTDYKFFNSNDVKALKSDIIRYEKAGNFYNDIRSIVLGKDRDLQQTKKLNIRQQYANIAILHNQLKYNSKLNLNLIKNTQDKSVFNQIDKDGNSVAKLDKFQEFVSIPMLYQKKVYNCNYCNKLGLEDISTNQDSYSVVLELLKIIYEKYNLHKRKIVEFERSYLYYARIIEEWINGRPMFLIIKRTIKDIAERKSLFLLDVTYVNDRKEYNPYNNSDRHINLIINDVFEKIENDVKHTLKTYIANYIYLNVENGNLDKSCYDIVDFIEFGTKNKTVIELQKYGFSREMSVYIKEKHSDVIDLGAYEMVDINKLFNEFDKSNVLFEELSEYKHLIEKV